MSRPVLAYPFPADMPPPSRAEIEAMIEGLIDYLDRTDGDADQEADQFAEELDADGRLFLRSVSSDDEPSLCGTSVSWPGVPAYSGGCGGNPVDLEDDRADFEDDGTGEPAMAAVAFTESQVVWAGYEGRVA